MSKSEVRQSALKARRSLPRPKVASLSDDVKGLVLSLPAFSKAKVVACYVSKEDEVQTTGIIQAALSGGKRVLVPRVDPQSPDLEFREVGSLSDLSPGHFHIMEPSTRSPAAPLSSADIVLVPVVAWDEEGNRIGYGMGYFDRALKSKGGALAVGLAFESQRYGSVPQTGADTSLDLIVTEKRVVDLKRNPR